MKKRQLNAYLIDVVNKQCRPVSIEPTLENYYKLLNCDLITITYREINGHEICIIADDEGLLKYNPIISAVTNSGEPGLVGNLLIVSADDSEDDFKSITTEEQKIIENNIVHISTSTNGIYPVLMMDY